MRTQTLRLRAMIDQARAAMRDRVAQATVTIGADASDEADSVVADYFGPLLAAAPEEDLADEFEPEFRAFLIGAGLIQWAELELERIEGETATS